MAQRAQRVFCMYTRLLGPWEQNARQSFLRAPLAHEHPANLLKHQMLLCSVHHAGAAPLARQQLRSLRGQHCRF